jgi:hypothetical protein
VMGEERYDGLEGQKGFCWRYGVFWSVSMYTASTSIIFFF